METPSDMMQMAKVMASILKRSNEKNEGEKKQKNTIISNQIQQNIQENEKSTKCRTTGKRKRHSEEIIAYPEDSRIHFEKQLQKVALRGVTSFFKAIQNSKKNKNVIKKSNTGKRLSTKNRKRKQKKKEREDINNKRHDNTNGMIQQEVRKELRKAAKTSFLKMLHSKTPNVITK